MLRTMFIGLSESTAIRAFAERSSLGHALSRRFVSGTTASNALMVAAGLAHRGAHSTIDNLGENVANVEEVRAASELYHRLLDLIEEQHLPANISLKLTQFGLDLDPSLCRNSILSLVEHAARIGNFVRVDMEGSFYTDATLNLVQEIHQLPRYAGYVGTVIQASLHRSESDINKLLSKQIRIRLCKGAYKEPQDIAFQVKQDVDSNFLKIGKKLLKSGVYHGLATHDERIIQQLKMFARTERLDSRAFEFQMLYGVRRDLQQQLLDEGWNVRVYIPFGAAWFPYFMRRLAERPANVWFIAKNILRK